MRCYICDAQIPDEKVKVNFVTKKIEPCPKCMEVIHDTSDSYEEQEIEVFPDTEESFWADTDVPQPHDTDDPSPLY